MLLLLLPFLILIRILVRLILLLVWRRVAGPLAVNGAHLGRNLGRDDGERVAEHRGQREGAPNRILVAVFARAFAPIVVDFAASLPRTRAARTPSDWRADIVIRVSNGRAK